MKDSEVSDTSTTEYTGVAFGTTIRRLFGGTWRPILAPMMLLSNVSEASSPYVRAGRTIIPALGKGRALASWIAARRVHSGCPPNCSSRIAFTVAGVIVHPIGVTVNREDF